MAKTMHEVRALIEQWKADPAWRLADTEGFDEHKVLLECVEASFEIVWRDKEKTRVAGRADELGIPGNVALVKHLEGLEARIERLERLCLS